jgi:hypothetical protein
MYFFLTSLLHVLSIPFPWPNHLIVFGTKYKLLTPQRALFSPSSCHRQPPPPLFGTFCSLILLSSTLNPSSLLNRDVKSSIGASSSRVPRFLCSNGDWIPGTILCLQRKTQKVLSVCQIKHNRIKKYSFCLMLEASDHGHVLHTRRMYVFSINGS